MCYKCWACGVDVILVLILLSDQQSSKTMFTINNTDIYGVCLLCENVVAMRLFISLSLFAAVKGANDLSVVMSYYPEIPGLSLRSPHSNPTTRREREREIHVPLSSTLINKHVILILVCFHGNSPQSQDCRWDVTGRQKPSECACFWSSSIHVISLV